ncbi:MAG: hypothetical protein IEMM0002_0903 [bacterium]|nr:MAG: hypothetical protein IEMM0002_0903 [bacterium]
MEESKIKEEVWKTIQAMNKAWAMEGDTDKLKDYFHQNMVAISAPARERIVGRDACIASWKAFVESAKIHRFKEIDPQIQLYGSGKFAVATYYYDMSFDMGGQTIDMDGRDMFVLVNEDGKWWTVADQFSGYPHQ